MDKTSVASNLRLQRKRKRLTQEQLSEMSGVAIRTIQRIENAKVEPHQQTLALLAESMGLEVHELQPTVTNESINQGDAPVRKWLLLLHLLPIVGFIVPFANLVLPFILWAYKQDEHPLIDAHGRAVVNFQLTVTLLFMTGVVLLVLYFKVGLMLLILSVTYTASLILWNTLRVMKNRSYKYPLSMKIL